MEKHKLISLLAVYFKDHIQADEYIYSAREVVRNLTLNGETSTAIQQPPIRTVPRKDPVEKQRGTLFSLSETPRPAKDTLESTNSIYEDIAQQQTPALQAPFYLITQTTTQFSQRLCKAINQQLAACPILEMQHANTQHFCTSLSKSKTLRCLLIAHSIQEHHPKLHTFLTNFATKNPTLHILFLEEESEYEITKQKKLTLWNTLKSVS